MDRLSACVLWCFPFFSLAGSQWPVSSRGSRHTVPRRPLSPRPVQAPLPTECLTPQCVSPCGGITYVLWHQHGQEGQRCQECQVHVGSVSLPGHPARPGVRLTSDLGPVPGTKRMTSVPCWPGLALLVGAVFKTTLRPGDRLCPQPPSFTIRRARSDFSLWLTPRPLQTPVTSNLLTVARHFPRDLTVALGLSVRE